MIREAIDKVVMGENLNSVEMSGAMNEIFDGKATDAQIAALITALRTKGETIEEITACAQVMRHKALRLDYKGDALEIVGTGGDKANTFNISTTSAFVAAAGGVKVAKHGNRSVSSKSGAADVLEALGARIDLTPEQGMELLEATNMVFLFAQKYHASMRYAGPVRKEIGIRTVFNILGPLTNPAFTNMEVMGVYDKKLVRPLAQVLSNLGVVRGFVFNGDGLDELTLTGKNTVVEIDHGQLRDVEIDGVALGLAPCTKADLVGGDAKENAQITKDILSGKERGAKRDTVVLNAGAALFIAGKAKNLRDGIELASGLIDSGAAYAAMEKFVTMSNKIANKMLN